jgi:hypothetical protein
MIGLESLISSEMGCLMSTGHDEIQRLNPQTKLVKEERSTQLKHRL